MSHRKRRGGARPDQDEPPTAPFNTPGNDAATHRVEPAARAVCTDDRPQADNEPFRLTLVQNGQRASQFAPGAALRRAREAQGLSLDDLCRLTKINVKQLVALEEGNLDALPGGVYVRGFLRAYAREVELDPEETVQGYYEGIQPEAELVAVTASQLATQGPPGHAKVSRLSRWRQAASSVPGTRASAVAHDSGRPHGFGAMQSRSSWLVTALAVIGLIVYLSFSQSLKQDASQGGPNGEQPVTTDVARASAENADSATPPVQAVQAPVPSVLQFEFKLQGQCWMSVQADGERVLSRLLQPGESQAFDVEDEIVLRVGDPGALTFSINGQAGRPFGRAGEPVNVRITKQNYREFLTPS